MICMCQTPCHLPLNFQYPAKAGCMEVIQLPCMFLVDSLVQDSKANKTVVSTTPQLCCCADSSALPDISTQSAKSRASFGYINYPVVHLSVNIHRTT